MPSSFTFKLQLCACAATFLAGSIAAQEPAADIIASWIALDAPTGHEHLAIESIQRNFSGWEKDRYGNLAKVVGDGTTFTVYGAPNAGLSWPGRYSHSPAEIADLRDIAKLIDLIQAMAQAPIDN